jgi:hypothetical protein
MVSEIGVPRLRLGKAEFQMPAAFFTDDRRMNDYAFDGLLGVSAACVREISVDFDNDLFSWKPRGSNLKCDGAYARLLKSAP